MASSQVVLGASLDHGFDPSGPARKPLLREASLSGLSCFNCIPFTCGCRATCTSAASHLVFYLPSPTTPSSCSTRHPGPPYRPGWWRCNSVSAGFTGL